MLKVRNRVAAGMDGGLQFSLSQKYASPNATATNERTNDGFSVESEAGSKLAVKWRRKRYWTWKRAKPWTGPLELLVTNLTQRSCGRRKLQQSKVYMQPWPSLKATGVSLTMRCGSMVCNSGCGAALKPEEWIARRPHLVVRKLCGFPCW